MAPRPIRRTTTLLLLAVPALWWQASPAFAAADVDDVADGIEDDGYYVDRDAEATESAVDNLVDDLSSGDDTVAVALLADDADGGAEDFAGEVFSELEDRDLGVETLYVVTPSDIGARSSVYRDQDLSAALDGIGSGAIVGELREAHLALSGGEIQGGDDATTDDPGTDSASDDGEADQAAASDDADTTTGSGAEAASDSGSGGGGGGGFVLFLVVIVGVIGPVWFLGRRKAAKRRQANLETAKAEAREQLTAVGNTIYDLNDRLTISDRDDLKERFATATAEFNEVTDGVKDATTGPQMADLHVRLDRLRWQVSAIEAELDGKPVPPEPTIVVPVPDVADAPSRSTRPDDDRSGRSATCFFDPTHRAATTSAWITSDGGREVEVRVCRSCAQRLERGERPDIRNIDVGGRRVPAPRAPGGYGGQGYDLPDSFDIRVSGMDRGLPIDLGPRPRRRGGGLGDILSGGLGGVILGGGGGRRRGGSDGLPRSTRSSSRRRDTGASAGRRRSSGGSAGRSR